jgi:hypothetical protein
MVKAIRIAVLALLAITGLLVMAACDTGSPAVPTAAPARPTATTEPVDSHRLRPRATPTTEEVASTVEPTQDIQVDVPTAVPTVDFGISYATYKSKGGDWSIDYPNDWQVSEQDPNVQFVEPSEQAFVQVTSSTMDPSNTNEDLVKIASDQLKQAFGDTYVEQGQEKQNDGSYRIDFTFTADDAEWAGQTFVEGRQSNLYMLFLATSKAQEESDKYNAIFNHVIDSYTLPDK